MLQLFYNVVSLQNNCLVASLQIVFTFTYICMVLIVNLFLRSLILNISIYNKNTQLTYLSCNTLIKNILIHFHFDTCFQDNYSFYTLFSSILVFSFQNSIRTKKAITNIQYTLLIHNFNLSYIFMTCINAINNNITIKIIIIY